MCRYVPDEGFREALRQRNNRLREWARDRGPSIALLDFAALAELPNAPNGRTGGNWHYMVRHSLHYPA